MGWIKTIMTVGDNLTYRMLRDRTTEGGARYLSELDKSIRMYVTSVSAHPNLKKRREELVTQVIDRDAFFSNTLDTYSVSIDMVWKAGVKKHLRVAIFKDGVDTLTLHSGMEDVDDIIKTLDGVCDAHYDSVDLLPKWVQERLSVLSMMPSTPPTKEVDGVGRRISANVYWVELPEHE